jgi:DMSO reductase family type II enzyme molybdopterin subunit
MNEDRGNSARDAGISRRGFIRAAGGALALSICHLSPTRTEADRSFGALPGDPQSYRDFHDLFRKKWTWDRVAKGTHEVNCWYQRCCTWNVFVKDGIVWREEQSATYPQTNPGVPDFNPRGCQKGACFSQRMYDPSRLRFPLVRVGARGDGKWKRISWEQALGEIAERSLDVLASDGPGSIIWDEGSGGSNLGVQRTHFILDTHVLDLDSEFGDHHPGAAVTCGKISFASSADDLHHSDLILIWGGNPTYTQIPNAHFIQEARYNGARVVAIAPDYNASAIHADRWIPVNVASDAAFGLSLAHVIIEEERYDARFIAEQTDLPLLVRTDTGRFLRESDLEPGGAEDVFFVFDKASESIRRAPKSSLALDGVEPALEGEFTLTATDRSLSVVPVFSLLRRHLSGYSPEAVAATTGTSPTLVRQLAREIASVKSATILTQSNFGKFYHGLEMERAQFLVLALAGQIGKKGSGINAFPNLWLSGHEGLIVGSGRLPPGLALLAVGLRTLPEMLRMKWQGHTREMMLYELTRRGHAGGGQPSSSLFLYRHGGLEESYGSSKAWDPQLRREFDEYLDEAFAKGWQIEPEGTPRIFFEVGGNYLRRNRAYPRLLQTLWPKLEMVVTLDWRMSFTGLHSDYVLPAAAYYEVDSVPWTTPIAPFAHVTTRAVEPLAESKSDWEFHCLFLKEVQRRARERGVLSYRDRAGEERRLDDVYERFTFRRRLTESNPEELVREAVSLATNIGDVSWEDLKQKGFQPYTGLGSGYMNLGNATTIEPGETVTANTWHTDQKRPWPTLTRRMQFYVDHDLYLELGEALPVHKDNPAIGGDYPLQMTSGHTRWSIHAAWRDDANLLRLQRGGPHALLAVEDAAARGIEDGEPVTVFNDTGSFELRAKISPAVQPGQLIVYHAWEPFQFKSHRSQQSITPSPINPIQLAGGYFHLQPRLAVGTPGTNDRGTRVEIRRLQQSA